MLGTQCAESQISKNLSTRAPIALALALHHSNAYIIHLYFVLWNEVPCIFRDNFFLKSNGIVFLLVNLLNKTRCSITDVVHVIFNPGKQKSVDDDEDVDTVGDHSSSGDVKINGNIVSSETLKGMDYFDDAKGDNAT